MTVHDDSAIHMRCSRAELLVHRAQSTWFSLCLFVSQARIIVAIIVME